MSKSYQLPTSELDQQTADLEIFALHHPRQLIAELIIPECDGGPFLLTHSDFSCLTSSSMVTTTSKVSLAGSGLIQFPASFHTSGLDNQTGSLFSGSKTKLGDVPRLRRSPGRKLVHPACAASLLRTGIRFFQTRRHRLQLTYYSTHVISSAFTTFYARPVFSRTTR